jgi:hypothetical protein
MQLCLLAKMRSKLQSGRKIETSIDPSNWSYFACIFNALTVIKD